MQAQPSGIQTQERNTLGGFLELRREHLEKVIPQSSAITADRLIKLTVIMTLKTPLLAQCDMKSVFQCLMTCAELGLDPSGSLGHAYLVPFKDKKSGKVLCQLIIGYRGLIDLARRSGALKQIEAHLVYEKDKFRLRFGLDPMLEHEPHLDGDPGKIRLAYVVAQLADGAKHVEVMSVTEINRIMGRSKSKDNGPWKSDWGEMAKKTVARRACKWIPMSSELARALDAEDEDVIDATPVLADATEVLGLPAQTRTEEIKARLRKPVIVDVQEGESEEQALDRVSSDPDAIPPDDIPLPGDDDAPAFGA